MNYIKTPQYLAELIPKNCRYSTYPSSIWGQLKSYLWGSNGEQPEVAWPEEVLNGGGPDRK